MPRPVRSAAQPSAEYREIEPEALIANDRDEIVFRTKTMAGKGGRQSFVANAVITVYGVESAVNEKKVPAYSDETLSLYKAYLAPDPQLASDQQEIQSLADEITGKEKNCYAKARLLYSYMQSSYTLQPGLRGGTANPADLLKRKSGDPFDFAAIYVALCRCTGIPAVQLAGVIVDGGGKSHTHSWAEVYLEDFGWLPIDLALACGLSYEGSPGREDRESYYFGNLDNQHIAFSRGMKAIKPSISNTRIVRRPRSYAIQTLWEESSERESSYSSYWTDPIITGIY